MSLLSAALATSVVSTATRTAVASEGRTCCTALAAVSPAAASARAIVTR